MPSLSKTSCPFTYHTHTWAHGFMKVWIYIHPYTFIHPHMLEVYMHELVSRRGGRGGGGARKWRGWWDAGVNEAHGEGERSTHRGSEMEDAYRERQGEMGSRSERSERGCDSLGCGVTNTGSRASQKMPFRGK
jgi:hypothetical protein